MNFLDFAEKKFDQMPLHSMQFREVFAKLSYKSTLSLSVPYYSFLYNEKIDHYVVSLLAFDDQNMTATSVTIGDEEGRSPRSQLFQIAS